MVTIDKGRGNKNGELFREKAGQQQKTIVFFKRLSLRTKNIFKLTSAWSVYVSVYESQEYLHRFDPIPFHIILFSY